MKHDLSVEQRRVVEFANTGRHLFVVAPAGSGKTLTITRRIAHLLDTGAAEPEQFLAMTFTERAANDLQGRLAALGAPGVVASTFHAFGAEMLREHGGAIGLSPTARIRDEQFQRLVIREAVSELGLQYEDWQIGRIKRAISLRKCEKITAEAVARIIPMPSHDFEAIEERYQAMLNEEGALDFDDLIVLAADLIWDDREIAAAIQRRFRYLFIDEFHDVSAEQYRLIAAVAPGRIVGRQVMAVADRNQAIYGFRGANADQMIGRYQVDYRPVEFTLRRNYRSSATIVAAGGRLVRAGGGVDPSIPANAPELPVDCFFCPSEDDEHALLAGLIDRACHRGYQHGDMAILYRKHERGDQLDQELVRHGIPIQRVRPDRFYNRPQVQEVLRFLDLLAVLHDRNFVPALNWPRVLVDELTMISLRQAARARGLPVSQLATDPAMLRRLATPISRVTIEEFLRSVVAELNDVVDQEIGEIVPRLLACLARRRDPIPADRREELRGTLDYLAHDLEELAEALGAAIDRGQPLVVAIDDDPDLLLAASLIQGVIGRYYGMPVRIGNSIGRADAFVIRLACARQGEAGDLVLAPRVTRTVTFTVTALAYRLCQLVLMRHEQLHRGRFVVYDLETTSTHAGTAEIVQIGAVEVADGRLTGEGFSTLVRPTGPRAIAQGATDVHGLTWHDVKDAPLPEEAVRRFLAFAGDAVLAGHNIDQFDHVVLTRASAAAGLPIPMNFTLDTLTLAQRLLPGERHRLDDLLTSEERRSHTVHEALADARHGGAVLLRLLAQLQRDREIDLLNDCLPAVGASGLVRGSEVVNDNALFAELGARTLRLADGTPPSELIGSVRSGDWADLDTMLAAHDPGELQDDADWQALVSEWQEQIRRFSDGATDRSLTAYLHFASLAASVDPDFPTSDAGRVTMSTIHSAKGREWPLVFLVGCEDETFLRFDPQPDAVAEERRVFYVAVTRAMRRLILTHTGEFNGRRMSPSRYIDELGDQVKRQMYCARQDLASPERTDEHRPDP